MICVFDEGPSLRRVVEHQGEEAHRVARMCLLICLEHLFAACRGLAIASGVGDVVHIALSGKQVYVQLRVFGRKGGAEGAHTQHASLDRAGARLYLLGLPEYLAETSVHPPGNLLVLPYTYGGEHLPHSVSDLAHLHDLLVGLPAFPAQDSGLVCRSQLLFEYDPGLVAAMVGTGTVAAVMTDIEGLVALWRPGVVQVHIFVDVVVVACAQRVFANQVRGALPFRVAVVLCV